MRLPWHITPAEARVFEAYIAWGTAPAAAARTGMHVSTIETHLARVFVKMRAAGVISYRHPRGVASFYAHQAWRRYWQQQWEATQTDG